MNNYEFVKTKIGSKYIDLIENHFDMNYIEVKNKYTRQQRIDGVYEDIKDDFTKCAEVEIKMALFMIDNTLEVFSISGMYTIAGKPSDYIKSLEENTKIGVFTNGEIKEYVAILKDGRTVTVQWQESYFHCLCLLQGHLQ